MQLICNVQNPNDLRLTLLNLLPEFKSLYSSYAPNRKCLWLFKEALLGRNKILPGFEDDRLYQFAQKVYPDCDIGLITYHGRVSNACILPHRDDRYAQPIARLVNLGNCTFGYCNSRIGNKLERYQLLDGGIYEFNCKHVHSVLSCGENRLSIVLWKLRPEFY